ncbi:hypothetical protein KRX51_03150 [Corynebacterium sp. TAE3-ERU12]|uniref:hypothetical protein n=1 Tax=Corynebacterium sp. TAE3-ERU12 TaxID=2849491 RepID=UPI001C482224|nr:hypothetical protein [Corynebacterium sp. TAE3-ERU12]MBV7294915.1 hypothetical protein [Corynebacterium sp. TAE3-ERU12]
MFLSEVEQDCLREHLRVLVVCGSRLDDVMVPTVPASGTNAGRGVRLRGSRPPLRVHPLDVKADAETCVRGWCACLREAVGGRGPRSRSLVDVAEWLRFRVPDIAACEWARDCAEEVAGHARRVGDLVDPPVRSGPPPGGVAPGWSGGALPVADEGEVVGVAGLLAGRSSAVDGGCPPSAVSAVSAGVGVGSARQVSQAMSVLGVPVSHTTIRAWARAGLVDAQLLEDGSQRYDLAQVWAVACQRRGGAVGGGDAG